MKLSKLFTKTRKTTVDEGQSKNADLLVKAGYIYKEMAGVYSYLPLGLKVFKNIEQIIREEMNKTGALEMSMSSLQDPAIWKSTNRWIDNPDVDVWFTTKLKNETELGLGFTHEEPITRIISEYVSSYRDLPFSAYQFQTKFRNETRAKSGIMRTREFVMKDLYTFCKDDAEHAVVYEELKNAYINTYKRLGIGDSTYVTFASGGVFSKYSHEFQTVCDAGEDEIYIDDEKHIAINKEVYNDQVLADLGVNKNTLRVAKSSEVGNIFSLGTKFSSALGLKYKNEAGEEKDVVMGSYGVGPARVMGVMVELLSDDKGLSWPAAVAPYSLHIVSLHKSENENAYAYAKDLYEELTREGVEVIWDDRHVGAGEKLNDADLLGMPMRVLVSEKSILAGGVEIKERKSEQSEVITREQLMTMYTKVC